MKELTTILATLPFGAFLGIFVKHFLDTISNRPKSNFFQRQIYLERLRTFEDDGVLTKKSVPIEFAEEVKLTAYIIATNSGKTNTAFSDIGLSLTNKSTGYSFFPKFKFEVDD
ncbi:hypothetical protein [Terribacillus sp. JSM ZJ617]|uniref:hypothetical protein n=1 Tax=Terribacillus sp. JSM ZJ617 TaxID=3342119 RepID=UPI0035A9ACB5